MEGPQGKNTFGQDSTKAGVTWKYKPKMMRIKAKATTERASAWYDSEDEEWNRPKGEKTI
jgi:hypothetical protein